MASTIEDIRKLYPNVRDSNAGLEMLGEGVDGYYLGPKDYADEENDIHMDVDSTHFKVAGLSDGKKFSFEKTLGGFLLSNESSLLEAMKKGADIEFESAVDKTSVVRLSTKSLPRDMCDMRVWFKDCVGDFKPTRNGIRLHYLHVLNFFAVLKKEM